MKSLNYDGEIERRNFGRIRPISLKWTEKFLHIAGAAEGFQKWGGHLQKLGGTAPPV